VYTVSSLGSTATAYDELGRTTDVTEASSSSPDIATITHTTYDALDRQLTQTVGYGGAAAQTTTTSYDLGGRSLTTDDEFTCATTTYDYRGLTLTETTGLVGGTCASGSVTRTISHTVDGLGRRTRSEVTSVGSPDFGDRPLDVTLDAAGRQLSAGTRKSGTTSTTTFSLDPLDEVLVEARPDGSTAKTAYDPAGNGTDRCYWKPGITVGACNPEGTTPWPNPPTQVATSVYDARNNRVELRDSVTATTTTYDPANGYQVSALYLPTGTGKEHQTIYGYDTRHRLSSVTAQLCTISSGHACSSTSSTGSDAYTYDDNDNRTTVVEANGGTSSDRRYCYDGLDRLRARQTAAACTVTSGDETYTYDDPGNRLTATGTTYTYDATTGQLTGCSPSCGTVSSDSAGNLKQFNGWAYEYDAAGRLIRACKAATCSTGSPDKVEFSYDGEGHRTQIKEYIAGTLTTTRDFRYQGDAIVEESTNGTVSRGYLVDDTGRILKVCDPSCAAPTTTYLVTWNGHGDALALWRINGDGTLTLANSYTYSTWGTPTTTVAGGFSDLKFRFLYVGASDVQWDDFSALGLAYMHARHYSPTIGRFLQPDPAAAEKNAYVYTGNSPVTQVDPSGFYPLFGSTDLNPIEQRTCDQFPARCRNWKYASALAIIWSRLDGGNAAYTNAIRHCMWQCLLTYWQGRDWAEYWAWAHEAGAPVYHPLDTTVDLHNNYVGRLFGEHLGEVAYAGPAVMAHLFCVKAWERGWLWYVSRNLRLHWSDGRLVNP
jgi:RHS repeat-associated protein